MAQSSGKTALLSLKAREILIPYGGDPKALSLGPQTYEPPLDIILKETNRIPFIANSPSLDLWADQLRAWPCPTTDWIEWYDRVANLHELQWQDALRLSLSPIEKDENLLHTIGNFWFVAMRVRSSSTSASRPNVIIEEVVDSDDEAVPWTVETRSRERVPTPKETSQGDDAPLTSETTRQPPTDDPKQATGAEDREQAPEPTPRDAGRRSQAARGRGRQGIGIGADADKDTAGRWCAAGEHAHSRGARSRARATRGRTRQGVGARPGYGDGDDALGVNIFPASGGHTGGSSTSRFLCSLRVRLVKEWRRMEWLHSYFLDVWFPTKEE